LIPLEGVRNFRDFGGYPTRWGGQVARGALFRSAHFAEATDADVARIAALGVKLVCDLRRPEERAAQPSRWPGEGQARVLYSEEGAKDEPPHMAFLKTGDLSPVAVAGYMRGMYREIPFNPRYVSLFSGFLRGLAEGESPAIVHCAAGKDRTGILCALTLLALETPEEAVIADFELTNQAVDLEERLPKMQKRFSDSVGKNVPRESILPLLGVEAGYLAASAEAITERCGGVGSYLRDVLGLDWATLEAMRARLVR
jgi:protein-tyrosine phosphatase